MWIWRSLGSLCLALGAIGIFLPVWPTTIFWIIAAVCFARSHPPTRDWIYARPGAGPIVEAFVEHGVITRANKYAALLGMALSGALIIFLLRANPWLLAASLSLLAAGMVYIISRRESLP